MINLVGKTDEFALMELSKKGITEENAVSILTLFQEIRRLNRINARALNMITGRYPKKEDGALKKYSGETITLTGVFISSKDNLALFRNIQRDNVKVVDHLWIKTDNNTFETGDYVEITGTVNKYLSKARTAIDGEIKEQYGIINATIRMLSNQIFKRS